MLGDLWGAGNPSYPTLPQPIPAPADAPEAAMTTSSDPVSLLRHLVAFPTVSQESNLPLLDWVQERLEASGAACRRTWNADRTKANLLATLGPLEPGGIVLSGHTDVVPATDQDWTVPPFVLTEAGARLYGRGTADMKGFIAVALALFPEIAKAPLRRPLHLALTYDEEVGCLGAGALVQDLVAHLPLPGLAWVGEPTSMQWVDSHKSIHLFRTRVVGRPAHSSQPHRGAGAIFGASRLIEELRRLGEQARARGESGGGEPRFDPPWTTVQVGQISGGTAVNILPGECTFLWEYRALPNEDPDGIRSEMERFAHEAVLPALREFAPEAEIETVELARVPPLRWPGPLGLEHLPGVRPGGSGSVSFATEGGFFQGVGIPTVVCGPGSIDQAHRPDEFVERQDLEACALALRALVEDLRAPL
jgi:acetylornithine deacetylase